jgi:hypothetical protein
MLRLFCLTIAASLVHHSLAAQAPSTDTLIARMKADLKNLVVSQEAHFADFATYAVKTGTEVKAGTAYFTPSAGNAITLYNVNDQGWSGLINHKDLPKESVTCGVFIGPAKNAPNGATVMEGAPACWGTGIEGSGRIIAGDPGSPENLLATMRSDLRNLVTAQEAYFVDNNTYAPAIGMRFGPGVVGFAPSGASSIVLSNVTPMGWSAVITNPGLSTGPQRTCGIYVGPARNAPNAAVTEEGRPACW